MENKSAFDYTTTKIARSPWYVDTLPGEADTNLDSGKPRFVTQMVAAKLKENYLPPKDSVMELTEYQERALNKTSHQIIGGQLFVNGRRYSMCNGD